jgi:hypothetical protein
VNPLCLRAVELGRKRLLDEVSFLESRSDIIHRIQSLTILGGRYDCFWEVGWGTFDEPVKHFWQPLSDRLGGLIQRTHNVRRLRLCSLVITRGMMESIVSLPNLTDLQVIECVASEFPLPISSTSPLHHLTLKVSFADPSVWKLGPSLANLQCLSLSAGAGSTCLPPSEVYTHWNPFVTLEKVLIDSMEPLEVFDLIMLIRESSVAANQRLRLTHFKISVTFGLTLEVIEDLLSCLEGAPIRVLALDGVLAAPPGLLDRIARTFPDLVSLTLVYRYPHPDADHRIDWALWPSPTWEYAQRLAGFGRLEYFGWNLDVRDSYSPRALEIFETGCIGQTASHIPINDSIDQGSQDQDDAFGDYSDHVAKLLAAHCPSLKTVVFLKADLPYRSHRIRRSMLSGNTRAYCFAITYTEFYDYDPSFDHGWRFTEQQ